MERAVQTVKQGIKTIQTGSLRDKVSRFLLADQNTPQSTMGQSPAEMLFNHQLTTHVSLLKPNAATKALQGQLQQTANHDKRSVG